MHRSEAVQSAEFRLQQMLQFPDGFLAGQASADRFLQEHTLLKWNVHISGYICKRTIRLMSSEVPQSVADIACEAPTHLLLLRSEGRGCWQYATPFTRL